MTQQKLKDRTALITGGSRGIGKAIAKGFAGEGANIFLSARGEGPLQQVSEEIREMGVKVAISAADVSDQRSVQEMVRRALKAFGRIDILVNNAGAYIPRRFMEYSLEEFDQVIKTNLYGVFHVTQAVLPAMIDQKKGKIINIASTAGKWGSKNQSAYNASKHGVVGLTRCLALEMAPFNINVNAICPALVEETGMTDPLMDYISQVSGMSKEEVRKDGMSRVPIGRFIKPEEVAALAIYLASDESDGMTAQSLSLCGGYLMI